MVELHLIAPVALVEAASDALIDELEALSVSVEDADADTADEVALFGEPGMPAARAGWDRSVLKVLFHDDRAATDAAALLMAQDWAKGQVHVQALVTVDERDWVRLTQQQFAPVEITPTFWIVPTWHEPPAAARQVIRLDPGLAFGTGTHPTTRMCLRWLARTAALSCTAVASERGVQGGTGTWIGGRALDYGCGSGILAIAAALHGAAQVQAVDIDDAALSATRANAEANGVVLDVAGPDAVANQYDLVLANILATPLKLLAPLLCSRLAPGAPLVLAGILERQADELVQAYAPWIELAVSDRVDGWVLMTGRGGSGAVSA
jgi:ribosomal protein L11 methyltransferase